MCRSCCSVMLASEMEGGLLGRFVMLAYACLGRLWKNTSFGDSARSRLCARRRCDDRGTTPQDALAKGESQTLATISVDISMVGIMAAEINGPRTGKTGSAFGQVSLAWIILERVVIGGFDADFADASAAGGPGRAGCRILPAKSFFHHVALTDDHTSPS